MTGSLRSAWCLVVFVAPLCTSLLTAQDCVSNIVATQDGASVHLTWTNGPILGGANVMVDGVLVEQLAAGATSTSIHGFPLPGSYTICFSGLSFPPCSPGCVTVDLTVDGDICSDPIQLAEKSVDVDITGAVADGSGGCGPSPSSTLDVYYQYVAEVTGTTRFSTAGSGFDTRLAAYFACPAVPATMITCNDDFGGPESEISVSTVAGQFVWLRYMVAPGTPVPDPGVLEVRCIDGLTCSLWSGSTYLLQWTPTGTFDSFDLYENGQVVQTFPGSTVSTFWTVPNPTVSELCIVGKNAAGEELVCSRVCCYVEDSPTFDDSDVDVTPKAIGPLAEYSLTLGPGTIEDIAVVVELSHPSVEDLRIEVESPSGTVVRLFDRDPSFQEFFDADEVLWASFSFLGASGPGSLDEFACQDAAGTWTVRIEDYTGSTAGTVSGAFIGVTHRIYCCPAPSGLTCTPELGSIGVDLTWTNSAPYTTIEVLVDGFIEWTLTAGQEAIGVVVPWGSTSTITVRGFCPGGGVAVTSCVVTRGPSPSGRNNVIWAPEGALGLVDSAAGLKAALTALGEEWVEIPDLETADLDAISAFSTVTPSDVLWVQLGTYPHNHSLTTAEGRLIVDLIQRGVGVFVEGADTFGFDPATELSRFDGVLDTIPGATDDVVTWVEGLHAASVPWPGFGLDVTGLDASYVQDQLGPDGNDTLASTFQDAAPGASFPLWEIDVYNGARTIGVYYETSDCHGDVISQSWELGGYGGNLATVVDRYLDVLSTISSKDRIGFESHPLGFVQSLYYNAIVERGVQLNVLSGNLQVMSESANFPAVSGSRLVRDPDELTAAPGSLEVSFRVPGFGLPAYVSSFEFSVVDAESPVTYTYYDHDDMMISSGSVTTADADYATVQLTAPYITRVVIDLGSGSETAALDSFCFNPTQPADAADLVATNIVVPSAVINGQPLTIAMDIANNGTGFSHSSGTAFQGWTLRVDEFNVASGQTTTVHTEQVLFTLHPGETQLGYQVVVNAPSYDPAQTLVRYSIVLDTLDEVEELRNENNNTTNSTDITLIELLLSDLEVTSVTPPVGPVTAGDSIALSFDVTNSGNATTSTVAWSDLVVLSTDPMLSIADAVENGALCSTPAIVAGAYSNPVYLGPTITYTQNVVVDLPLYASGDYYVYVVADRGFCHSAGLVPEHSDSNNLARSVGSFTVQPAPDPDLFVPGFGLTSTTANSGDVVSVAWQTQNLGMGDTPDGTWGERVYASPNNLAEVHALDVLIAQFVRTGDSLEAGQSEMRSEAVTIPASLTGVYYLKVETDSEGWITEADEDNVGVSTNTISIAQLPPIDLSAAPPVMAPTTVFADQSIEVSWSVTNSGGGPHAPEVWTDRIYLSLDSVVDGSDVQLGESARAAGPGEIADYTASGEVAIPRGTLAGTYFVLVSIDANQDVFEALESNNTVVSGPITVQSPTTDLTATILSPTPTTGYPGEEVTVHWRVTNSGSPTSAPIWADIVGVGGDLQLVEHEGTLGSGESYDAQATLVVQSSVPPPADGVTVNSGEVVFEVGAAAMNNFTPIPFMITTDGPDLQVTSITVMTPGGMDPTAGDSVEVSYTITNHGTREARGPWVDSISIGGSTTRITRTASVASLASYTHSEYIEIPLSVAGATTIAVFADVFDDVPEQDDGNNDANTPITVTEVLPPNLIVTNVTIPSSAVSGQDLVLDWTITNDGSGWTAASSWHDRVYLSYNAEVDAGDIYLGEVVRVGALPNNTSYTVSNASFQIPFGLNGHYFVLVETDGDDVVVETTNVDNARASSSHLEVVIPQPADLAAVNVSGMPGAAVCGDPLTVEWQIENCHANGTATGLASADGSWVDSVYLSKDGILDALDIPLGELLTADMIPACSTSGVRSLTVTVPPTLPGTHYQLLVLADAEDAIAEVQPGAPNLGVSATSLTIEAHTVPNPGQTLPVSIDPAGFRLYELVVPGGAAGSAVLLTVSDLLPQLEARMLVSFGGVPTAHSFDFESNAAGQVVIPATQTGTYYILVSTDATVASTISVSAVEKLFDVTDVQPQTFGNVGQVTFRVSGARFTPSTSVHLRSEFGSTVQPRSVSWVNAGQLRATFDLETPVGEYTLVASDPMEPTMPEYSGLMAEPAIPAYITLNPTPIAPLRNNYVVDITTLATNSGNLDAQFLVLEHRTRNEMADVLETTTLDTLLVRHLPDDEYLVDMAIYRNLSPGETVSLTTDLLVDGLALFAPLGGSVFSNLAILSGASVLSVDEMRTLQQEHAADVRTAALAGGAQEGALAANSAALASEAGWEEHWLLHLVAGGFFDLQEVADLVSETQPSTQSFGDGGPGPLPVTPVTADSCQETVSWGEDVVGRVAEYYQALAGAQLTPDPIMTEVYLALATATQESWDVVECTLAELVSSFDPNGKSGPGGFGIERFVGPKSTLSYRINFENLDSAAAPARIVRIEDQLSDLFDLSTVRFGDVAFGSTMVPIAPTEGFALNTTYDSGSGPGGVVQVHASIDTAARTLTWSLEALDANSLQPIVNGNHGFLPPENGSGQGQGYVEFTVKATATPPPDEDDMINRAKITFDNNEPLLTAYTYNELDSDEPSSLLMIQGVNPFAFQGATQTDPLIQLNWSGSDAPGGAGLKHYDIFVAVDGGSYFPIRTGTSDTSMTYLGNPGSTYDFYSVAIDNVENTEAAPPVPDATVTIDANPVVAIPPVGATVCPGERVELVVVAQGAPPLLYQWFRDGALLAGETDPVVVLDPAVHGDSGSYTVEVTNGFGTITSAAAIVTVSAPPAASIFPSDQTVCNGAPLSLFAVAGGAPPLSYQWYRDGTLLPGATGPSYSTLLTTMADAGAYHVVVTGGCGQSGTSATTTVAVVDPPVISSSSGPAMVCEGDSMTLTATVPPDSTADYQWHKDGVPILFATMTTYTVAAASIGDSGAYHVVATNPCGTATGATIAVTVESCGTQFVRGDCNADGTVNIADAVRALDFLFGSASGPGAIPVCFDACDGQDDGSVNIADAVAMLSALFGMPPLPLAPPSSCGLDPTPNDPIDCQSFPACP